MDLGVIGSPAWLPAVKFDSCITCYYLFILIVSFCVLSSLIIKKNIIIIITIIIIG